MRDPAAAATTSASAARAAATPEDLLRELFDAARSEEVTPERVHLALREQRAAGRPRRQMRREDELTVRVPRGGIRARGAHQRDYLAHIRTRDLTFGIGPAGTGKTYLAVACAVEALQADRVRRIVLVRPAVEAGERLGFLPGDLTQKVDPYLRPMYDALYEMMGFDRVARFIERNVIEVAPLAFMRGRSLNDSFIILDEAQNTTIEQMKMFLTRIGFGSKAVVTGDVTQTDLPAGKQSGLRHVDRQCCAASRASPSPSSMRTTWCAIRWCSASCRPTKRSERQTRRRRTTPASARRCDLNCRRAACAAVGAAARASIDALGERGARARRARGRELGVRVVGAAREPRASTRAFAARTYRPTCCRSRGGAAGCARGAAQPLGDLVICARVLRARGARAGQDAARALGAPRRARRAASDRLRPRARRGRAPHGAPRDRGACAASVSPNPYRSLKSTDGEGH